jgi:predicted dehydrogenase
MDSVRALVIGYGSIGRRHARVLTELGCRVGVVSRRAIDFPVVFASLAAGLAHWQPDYVVVANRTNEHFDTLAELAGAGFVGKVLVEKPLFADSRPLPAGTPQHLAVAYNLRFHPLLKRLKEILESEQGVLCAHVYTGHYLPAWRPGTDYRDSYSSHRSEGGGVLRDISHELDYCLWLFGPWLRLAALGGRFGGLEIDSDDCFTILMATERCPSLCIHLNYLDRVARREIIVNTVEHTVRVDLDQGLFALDDRIEAAQVEWDYTYLAEHQAVLDGQWSALCSVDDGLAVLAAIEAVEEANRKGKWVER